MSSQPMSSTGHHWWQAARRRTTAVQQGATAMGWVLLLLGVAGFLPLFTTHFSGMAFAGPDSTAELFGVFSVSVLSNLVFLALGVLGLFMGWGAVVSRRYLIIGGAILALLGLYGLIATGGADFMPANAAAGWLHVGLGLVMIAFAFVLHRRLPKESEARGEGAFGETNRGAAG